MVKRPVVAGVENGPNTIFKATYSGVPVYEMLCRNVAVMRRRSDSYFNATQILKVAGFDKPQRTRVLEREVQKGEHEKVQGGYGKYQGTWIPIERGLALAKQYGVEDLLRPIIDYVPTSVSPPPAPKHAVAPPTKTKKDKDGNKIKGEQATPSKTGPTSAAALTAQAALAASRTKQTPTAAPEILSTPDADTSRSMGDSGSLANTPDDESTSSRTPSPVGSILGDNERLANMGIDLEMDISMDSSVHDATGGSGGGPSRKKRSAAQMLMMDSDSEYMRRARGNSAVLTPRQSPTQLAAPIGTIGNVGSSMGVNGGPNGLQSLGPDAYTDIILNYFISESSQIPSILVSPPADFDPNTRIDEDGHTALHWACAMGRVRVVKLLLTAGASIFSANNSEQTPLMRSVMFSNNYDVRKFSELYELLHRSTLNIDKNNKTVFHHISNLALTKGKTHAARYYMETILSRLSDFPQELADVINFQDEDGETALTLAARARSKKLVKSLLDHGADPKIKNRDFKSAEDYILEDERFRSSPVQNSNGTLSKTLGNGIGGSSGSFIAPQLFSSEAARLAGGTCLSDITAHMQNLAKSFDNELTSKERDILQAKALLTNIHGEVTEASRVIISLNEQTGQVEEKKRELEGLQAKLSGRIGECMKKGWSLWSAGEDLREAKWKNGAKGDEYKDLDTLMSVPEGAEVAQAEEDRLRWEVEEKRRKRGELMKGFVKAQAEAGTGEKIAQYRRLISAGVNGTIAVHEVDNVMTQLLETLENESSGATLSNNVSWS